MPNSPKAKTVYFNPDVSWVLEKFTPKEISRFFKDGKNFFEKYLVKGPGATQFLDDHPEFKEVLDKW